MGATQRAHLTALKQLTGIKSDTETLRFCLTFTYKLFERLFKNTEKTAFQTLTDNDSQNTEANKMICEICNKDMKEGIVRKNKFYCTKCVLTKIKKQKSE